MIIATIYNTSLAVIGNVVQWKSLIRKELLRGAGNFEMKLPASPAAVSSLLQGYFISFSDTPEKAFLIESVEPDILNNDANTAVVSGRDLKALLDQRIVWKLQTVKGTAWNRMYWLMYYNAISPADSTRKIPYLANLQCIGEDRGSTVTSTQYTGDNLLEACIDTLGTGACGWRMKLNVREKTILNEFYTGADKTSEVQFHSGLGNLKNVSYLRDVTGSANVALIGGEGEGADRTYTTTGSASGLERREMFVDARDLQSEKYDSTAAYTEALITRGNEKLAEKAPVNTFSFDAIPVIYQYGTDYNLGDTIRAVSTDVLGLKATARVIGMQISDDSDGHNETPTLEILSTEVTA